MAIIRVKPGVVTAQDGTYPEWRGTRKGAGGVQDLGGRYEEAVYRGNVYSASTAGGGVTLATANLFSTAVATWQPIVLIYNPLTSKVNLSILLAWGGVVAATLASPTQAGSLLWMVNSGQSITNAQSATPVNNGTLKASGSAATGITNVVLAGAVGNPILLRPMQSLMQLVTATANTQGQVGALPEEEVAGSIMVPPGGYAGLSNSISNNATGTIVVAGLTWEEIPL